MQVARWGNSLAVRLPTSIVEIMQLKEGDDIAIHAVGMRSFEIEKLPGLVDLLGRIRKYRGKLPPDFHFDRLEACEK